MALLLIEDDQNIILSLSLALNNVGFKIDTATNGLEGLEMASLKNYELILLDCNLPDISGFEIVKRLRSEKIFTPIIILTVLEELNDKVELFNLGSDDYLTKPFAFAELLARIRALLRRPRNFKGEVLKIGTLELDPDRFTVFNCGKKINLSSKEFSLLEYLIINQGKYISRQELMEEIWDENADPFSNTIEVHIMNIRKKLGTESGRYIFTAANRGYKIDLEK
jgi:DNA-binding response OmpR family regulator